MPHWLAFWMKHCSESRPGELRKYLCSKRVPECGDYPLARLIELPTEKRGAADDPHRAGGDRQLKRKRDSY
jgi:hypothetical protein